MNCGKIYYYFRSSGMIIRQGHLNLIEKCGAV